MNLRPTFFAAVLLGVWLLSANARAHSPFDCSARVIVQPGSAAVMLTVGTALGEKFLATTGTRPGQLPMGHPFALHPGSATNFFLTTADGKILAPRTADVVTDGLEFQFQFEYALPPAKSLGVETFFIPALAVPRAAPLVLTDENGNLLASAVLAPGKTGAEFFLPAAFAPPAAVAIQVEAAGNKLRAEQISAAVSETKTTPSFGEFLRLGIEHILTGYDHLLFLLALLLGCRRLKTMLVVITGFTVAHSLTLALAALNVVTLSPRLVEPMIAASIIFVALGNFRRTEKSWPRYTLTCGFGLIHGFGFASALRESGLGGYGAEIVPPLLAFNLGVEIGQLTVAAALLPLLFALRKIPAFERRGAGIISLLVIVVAACWCWQRIW